MVRSRKVLERVVEKVLRRTAHDFLVKRISKGLRPYEKRMKKRVSRVAKSGVPWGKIAANLVTGALVGGGIHVGRAHGPEYLARARAAMPNVALGPHINAVRSRVGAAASRVASGARHYGRAAYYGARSYGYRARSAYRQIRGRAVGVVRRRSAGLVNPYADVPARNLRRRGG